MIELLCLHHVRTYLLCLLYQHLLLLLWTEGFGAYNTNGVKSLFTGTQYHLDVHCILHHDPIRSAESQSDPPGFSFICWKPRAKWLQGFMENSL